MQTKKRKNVVGGRTNGAACETGVNAVRWAHAHVWAYVCDAAIVDASVTLKLHPSTVSLPVVWFGRIIVLSLRRFPLIWRRRKLARPGRQTSMPWIIRLHS